MPDAPRLAPARRLERRSRRASAAADRSAPTIACELARRPTAEERERDVEVLPRHEPSPGEVLARPSARGRRASCRASSSARKSRRRSSPSTLPAEVIRLRADFVSETPPREVERGDRRPRADRLAVGRERELAAPLAAVRRRDVEVDEPDRLLVCAAARPRDPGHRDPDVDAEPRRARPSAIASATSADTAPCSASSVLGDAELAAS